MNITFHNITSLDEVNFDDLFLSSFPDIEYNFLWPSEYNTVELRKEFYLSQLNLALTGQSPIQRTGDVFWMYKIMINGVDHSFTGGFIEQGSPVSFRGHWYLTKSYNNSRSWIFGEAARIVRNSFFAERGVTALKAPTHTNALMYSAVKRNNEVVEEVLTQETPSNQPNLVTLILNI